MKKYLLQFSISTLFTISAQSSPFKSFDIVIYPEYYFSGVMAEVEAEIFEGNLPLNLKFQVPTNTDSVFYVSGDSESPSIDETDFSIKGDIAHIDKIITDKKFRIFIFYGLEKMAYVALEALIFMLTIRLMTLTLLCKSLWFQVILFFPKKFMRILKINMESILREFM